MAERGIRRSSSTRRTSVNLGSPTRGDVREVGRVGRPQPEAGRADRRRGRGRAHRVVPGPRRRRLLGAVRRRDAPGPRGACCRCSTPWVTPTTPPWLLLEPTAGRGRSLCAGVEDLGAVPRGPRPPPEGRDLPGHLPRLRRRRAARRAWRHDGHRRPDRRDRRPRAAAAGARQRLDGRARRVQGPAPAAGPGAHRRGRVRRAARPPRDRRACRSSWRPPTRATPTTRDIALLKRAARDA